MQNGVYVEENISIWGQFHNKRVFCYKIFSVLIIYQGLSFGGYSLKIELVVFKPGARCPQAGACLVF